MISFRKAFGLQVVTRKEGAVIGRFDDFQFDLSTRAIYGYRLRGSGMFAKAGGVRAELLDQVGRDVVFVNSEADVEWVSGGRNEEEGRAWASQYRGTRVMSRAGVSLGEVEDFVFDPAADRLLGLLVEGGGLAELDEHVVTGPAAVVVDDPSVLRPIEDTERGASREPDWRRWLGLRRKGGGEGD